MKAIEREPYRVLAAEIDWGICGFCRYNYCTGSACDDGDSECRHPIEAIAEHEFGIFPSDDCWGFRAKINVSTVADIVGIALAENYDPGRMYWQKDGKEVRVFGTRRKSNPPIEGRT